MTTHTQVNAADILSRSRWKNESKSHNPETKH